jgi:aryl-alcohol dehydrogenase-like predicted oxidoreductase
VAPLHATQPPYNIFEREIEKDVLPYSLSHDLVVLSYGAICRGLLSGKITAERRFPESDLRSWDPKFQPPRIHHYLAAVERIAAHAKKHYNRSILALPSAGSWIAEIK